MPQIMPQNSNCKEETTQHVTTLTSLQTFFENRKHGTALSLNCLRKNPPPKFNWKHLGEAENARNVRMYESVMITQQKKNKSISLQIRLLFILSLKK